MSIGAVGYSTDFYRAGYSKNSSNDSASKFTTRGLATQETIGDLFSEAVQKFHDANSYGSYRKPSISSSYGFDSYSWRRKIN